jgi:predicted Zn-dependent protease
MKTYHILFILAATFLLVACAKVAFTGRNQVRMLPESQLTSMALTEYQQFLQENKLSTNQNQQRLVKEVGGNLVRAAEQYYRATGNAENLSSFKWEFNLVENEQVNAWAMPGGKVVIYTGILPVTQNTDALAVLMGHEMAHALAFHGNERMSQGLLAELGGVALDVATQNKPEETRNLFRMAYGVGAQVGALLPFSRKHESEADEIGLYIAAMAGYNIEEAVPFWQRMNAKGGGRMPEFLSTHPDPSKRSETLKKLQPKALEYKRKYGIAQNQPRKAL